MTKIISVVIQHKGNQWKIHWLRVTPVAHEGLGRFRVQSEHGSALYLVDLQSDQGSGRCACTNFSVERSKDPAWLCKHCRAARLYLGEELVERWIETRHEQDKTL